MSTDTLRDPAPGTGRTVTWRPVAVLAVLAVLGVAPYLAGVLIPYYVNDLDALPLAEVASGAHDPKDLWPQGFVGGWVQAGGFLSMVVTPLTLVCVLGGCVAGLVAGLPRQGVRRMSWDVAIGLVAVGAACVGGLAFELSPLGSALATWRMD